VALLSSGGIFREDQAPFDPWAVNDLSFRLIPRDTLPAKLKIRHNYFDHRDALKDLNCVFPLERLQDLERSGIIGRLAPAAVTLGMGRLYKRTELLKDTVPKILEALKGQEVDAALLVAA
jgi:D-proline reductase (dithiol) PrdB